MHKQYAASKLGNRFARPYFITRSKSIAGCVINRLFAHPIALTLISCFFITFVFSPVFSQETPQASIVRITGAKGKWVLEVNGKPFYVKGVVVGEAVGRGGEDYLKLAQDLGANAVRTWGTDQGTKEYFDSALKYGLMVDAGIGLNYVSETGGRSYINDAGYKEEKVKEITEYVNKFKDHPALLMWNVGNEEIFFTKDAQEKAALSKFLEEMVKLAHKLDPNHPVVYTSADVTDMPYIEKYVPSLDIFGMNIYGSIKVSHGKWNKSTLNIPYIVTEYGPPGPWAVKKDKNGVSIEQPEQAKAAIYRNMTKEIINFKGYDLGGFVFHLGETSQESLTWWNLNYKMLKKPSFWEIYKIYRGGRPLNLPPRITRFELSRINKISPGKTIDISAEASDSDSNPLDYSFTLTTAHEGILKYYANEEVPAKFVCEGIKFKLVAPNEKGLYRMYLIVNDGHGNVAAANKSIKIE